MTWPVTPIRRLFRVVNGGTPTAAEENWGGDVPWATPVDLGQANGVIRDTQRSLTRAGAESGSRIVPRDSLILSTRAPIGYVVQTQTPMAFNQGCKALVPTSQIDVRFYFYQLDSLTSVLQSRGQGATFLELSGDALASISVVAPPLEEQRRIADFLDGETSHIKKMQDLQQHVRSLLVTRQVAMLDLQIQEMERSYGVLPFRRFMLSSEQGSSPLCDSTPAGPGEWGVLKVSSVKDGRFYPEENKRLPSSIRPTRRYAVRRGDLLITRANTPALVGAAAVAPQTFNNILLCDKIFRINLTRDMDADFVAHVARGTMIRGLCRAASHGTSQSMVNLKIEDIKEWPLPTAPMVEQRALVRRVSEDNATSEALIARIDRQIALLAERRQALITAAVTGQIDVTTARGISA